VKQNEHLFQFLGSAIAQAARELQSYHAARLGYWQKEQEGIVEAARNLTATVKVREQNVTGGKRYEIVADITGAQDLNWKLQTAGGKIDQHRTKVDEYGLKAAAYETQPARAYELDPSDVQYFRLSGGPRDE
jgi:hypothetical protein